MATRNSTEPQSKRAYDYLRDMIAKRAWPAGERLSIRWVSQRLGVSVTPVTAAVEQLEREGLLFVAPRSGTTIRPLGHDDIQQIFGLRRMIEIYAARIAVELAPDSAIDEAKACVAALANCIDRNHYRQDKIDDWMASDYRLHEIFVENCGNPLILETYRTYNVHLHIVRNFQVRALSNSDHGQKEHERIVKAFEQRDAEALVDVIDQHLSEACYEILRVVATTGVGI
ncbi:GntR family transcriptional regulator [bacterium]|nr:MAG: GntR family transcriptional regulator [bacterium]